MYVKQAQPTTTFNESMLVYNQGQTIIPLVWFDLSNVPPCATNAKLTLRAGTQGQSTFLGNIYTLNTSFTENTTYNTKPNYTLLKTINDWQSYQNLFSITIPNILQLTNGITFNSYNGYECLMYGVKDVTDAYRPRLDYSYTQDDSTVTLTTTGNNIDDDITVSWTLANQLSGKVRAYQNDVLVATKTVTTVNASVFVGGTFKETSNIRFEVEASTVSVLYTANTTIANLSKTMPSIIALEPNNVNQDKDTDITVSWLSSNQDTFKLQVGNRIFTGTTAKGIVIPKGTFTKLETVNMTLAITYTSSLGEIRTATKSASFLLVGKPSAPQIEKRQYYSDAQPVFKWVCIDDYVQYRCEVYKSSTKVFDSEDVVSSAKSCQCTATLENNTQYTVKVKVKTQFGYWSDYDTNTFTTQFVVANKPSINVYTSENSIIINSDTVYSEVFDSCEIYRKTDNTEWVRIAFNLDNNITYVDRFIGAETYYYKVTSVSTNNAKNDSDIASASISINNFNFANVEDIENGIELIGNPSISITQNRQVSTTLYSGCYAPVIESGIQNYKSGSASFTVRKNTYDKLLSIINNSKVLIYRDRRGEKFYCSVTSNLSKKYSKGDIYDINFTFVEVPFEEKDMYSGEGNLPIIFFDGTYKFDGTVTFNAELPE